MEAIFWTSVGIIVYTYIGYGVITAFLALIEAHNHGVLRSDELPETTLIVAAYNEEDIIEEKIKNTLALEYPQDKLKLVFVTDGSSDRTPDIVAKYPQITLYHQNSREGKIAAINRIMKHIKTPFTIFSDANVMINPKGVCHLMKRFKEENTAAVSGEKVVMSEKEDGASSSGEGFYWKYESYLKKCDAKWNTLVGSAGELFAMRTKLYKPVASDTLIEDFVMTMDLAAQGYHIAYAPDAIAMETGSLNIEEETKRKVRISAGGIQAVLRLKHLLNPFKYGALTFQYISHRALRWTLAPVALITALISGIFTAFNSEVFFVLFIAQAAFYALALVGYSIRNKSTKYKITYIPYYFIYMHYCVILGWFQYFNGNQKVTWDKAKRAHSLSVKEGQ